MKQYIAQQKQVVQGRRGKICEIVHKYIEQIMTKSDTVIRSLCEARIRRLDTARRLSY